MSDKLPPCDHDECPPTKCLRRKGNLNDDYRNGGDLVEEREEGRDSISAMRLEHSRPDVLANALLEMGITENGDDIPDIHERT